MKLHPRIKGLYDALQRFNPTELLSMEVLDFLKDQGVTATEATMVFHLAYEIKLEDAEEFVFDSNFFPKEEISDTAYQTFTYLYYDRTLDS
jgi:hypothetical protein